MSQSKAKIVMITGVTRGLGKAMVDGFANLGWTVAGCGRSEDALAALRERHGSPHHFVAADLASDASAAAFVRETVAKVGTPDLVLNNGAVINESAPLWEIEAEAFSDLIDINIKGTASIIRAVMPALLERGSGVIVNFSSGWGRSTSPEVAPYCASKWAIEGLSAAMAQEVPKGIAVAAMNPGIIHTEMLQKCFGPGAAAYPGPEDWADSAVPFLAKLDARCNGRALTAP